MKKILLLFAIFALGLQSVMAQTREITGKVTLAEDGTPMPGVTVAVKGTATGAITGNDGTYTLRMPSEAETLVFSFIGMKTVEAAIKGQTTVNIKMERSVHGLEEVMVVAYGTAKKESFTGSAEVIKSDKISTRPIANVSKAIDGLVAGVQSTSGSGQPGSGASVVIRGYGSINSSQTPLYVVDGVPYNGNVSAINPNDIESMTILKDASAGALYGARGANGVVMITTKKGKSGKVQMQLKANWGIASRSVKRYDTVDEAGYLEVIFQSYKNDQIYNNGLTPETAGAAALEAMKGGTAPVLGLDEQYNPFNFGITELIDPATGKVRSDAKLKYSEDWLDEAEKNNPLRQEYDLSFTGGDDKNVYMFSLGYLSEQGLLETTKFRRYSGRMRVESEVTNWLKADMAANYSRNESNTAVENNSTNSNVWYSAQLMAPIYPVFEKDATGATVLDELGNKVFDYGANRPAGASANWNTIATLYDDKYSSTSDNLSGRMNMALGDLETGPLQGLKLNIGYGFDLVNAATYTYYNPYNGNSASIDGRISKATGRTYASTLNQVLTYDRKFGLHHVDALVGHEYYSYTYDYLNAVKTGFPFGGLYELDAATTITGASSYKNTYRIESVLSRLNYDYNDRYYFSVSFRTDGTSRFNKDNRWGQFWSTGANWRVSEENFMQNVDWVNNLSVKASYGVQGNDGILDSSGYSVFYAWQSFYDLGYPNNTMSGAVITSLENKELKWEKNANLNIGIEAKIFDRFSATIEWYKRKTTDMLMNYPMASSLGFDGYLKNIGEMENKGLDVTLSYDIFKDQDFNWTISLLGSTVKNKVLKLSDKPEIISGSYIIKEGETLNSFYTATSGGVDPATGLRLYRVWDTDNDGVAGERYLTTDMAKANECKEIKGNRIPDLYGSVNNEFKYRGFDLNIQCNYSIGGKILDGNYRTLIYGNYVGQAKSKALERAWKQPGDVTDIPRIEIGKSYAVTDDDLIDASYFTIKNITLGYTLPQKTTKAMGMGSVRITASGDNLALFNCLNGMDPQYNLSGGTNFGYVPIRTITLGIDVNF